MWLHLLYLCVTVVQYLADVCCCCFLRDKPMMLLNSCHDCRLTGGFVFWIIYSYVCLLTTSVTICNQNAARHLFN